MSTASSTGGTFKATKFPPADLGVSMEDVHDPDLNAAVSEPVEQETVAGTGNVVDINYLLTPGAGTREKAHALATLDKDDYDKIRKAQAKEIGCRVSTLDEMVEEERRNLARPKAAMPQRQGWDVDPVAHPVAGAGLFDSIEALISSHVVLPKGAATAITVWVAHTWVMEASRHTPLLALLSPEPECGKTTTLKVLRRLCKRPKPASNISPAAIYYAIEQDFPTLIMDELDSMPDGGEACRNVLNSGHEREFAYVSRTEDIGGERKLVEFSTYCAKIVASIGKLKPTLMSRALIIWLRRKSADETVMDLDESEAEFTALPGCLARWADDNLDAIKKTKPALPATLANRGADNWRELFRIVEVVGGHWPAKLTAAVSALVGARKADTATNATMLFEDIKAIFESECQEVLRSETIVGHLEKLEHRPWPDWKGGRPLTAQQMAKLLEPFDIAPRQNWNEGRNVRGYRLADFLDTFARYLPRAARPARSLDTAENCDSQETDSSTPSGLAPLAAFPNHGGVNIRDYNADPLTDAEFPDIPTFMDRRRT